LVSFFEKEDNLQVSENLKMPEKIFGTKKHEVSFLGYHVTGNFVAYTGHSVCYDINCRKLR